MTTEIAIDLEALLSRAHILMFEYDADGYLLSASGSCLGGTDPRLEIRAGLITPQAVRRACSGERVVERTRLSGLDIEIVHEPVRSDRGVERVRATAYSLDL